MSVWPLVAFLWKCQCMIRGPEQVSEDQCKVKVYYQLVRQKNLGVGSNPRPRAWLASTACRRASAPSRGRIDVHTEKAVSVVAVERGVVHFTCTEYGNGCFHHYAWSCYLMSMSLLHE